MCYLKKMYGNMPVHILDCFCKLFPESANVGFRFFKEKNRVSKQFVLRKHKSNSKRKLQIMVKRKMTRRNWKYFVKTRLYWQSIT